MRNIVEEMQDILRDVGDDYILKTNDQIIDIISEFGCGETEFHTVDISRLLTENEEHLKLIDKYQLFINKLNMFLDNHLLRCEESAEVFRKSNMEISEISSQAMGTAYYVVKQFIDINKVDNE